MANEKEMGRSNLEEALRRQFPNDDIDKLLEKIDNAKNSMKLDAEENPFFYGRILQEISLSNSTNIAEWIDENGVAKIITIAKICKEEKAKEKAEQEEKRRKEEEKRSIKDTEERDVEKIKETLDAIDYENLDAESLFIALENFDLVYTERSIEDVANVLEAAQVALDIDKTYLDMVLLSKKKDEYKKNGETYEYTEDDWKVLKTAEENSKYKQYIKYDSDGRIDINEDELKNSIPIVGKLYSAAKSISLTGGELTSENIVSVVKGNVEADEEKIKSIMELVMPDKLLKELNNLSISERNDKLNSILSQEHNKQFNSSKITEQLQIENDQKMDNAYKYAPDYYIPKEKQQISNETLEEIDNPIDGLEDELFDALNEYDMEEESKQAAISSDKVNDKVEREDIEQVEQTQDELQSEENPQVEETVEEMQPVQEDEYIEDIQEEETQTGLAGIFGSIKDKVTNFFKRVNQKALPDPDNQRVAGGSLVPRSVAFRNALTKFSVNTIGNAMQALGKLVGINNREEVKNTIPTEVIKSESLEEDKIAQQENLQHNNELLQNQTLNEQEGNFRVTNDANTFDDQTLNKQEGDFRDNNPWAVKVSQNMEKEAIKQMADKENEQEELLDKDSQGQEK